MLAFIFSCVFLVQLSHSQLFSAGCKPELQRLRWINWDEQRTQYTDSCSVPRTMRDLDFELARARNFGYKIKVYGTGHSFSDIATPKQGAVALSMDNFNDVFVVNMAEKTATFSAGLPISVICDVLFKNYSMTIENLGTSQIQNYVGAFATGTHGTGKEYGNIATQVVSFCMKLASSQEICASKTTNKNYFYGARVGLGAIGIVLNVTVRIVPAFKLRRVDWLMPTTDLVNNIQNIASTSYQFMAWGPFINKTMSYPSHTHVSFWYRTNETVTAKNNCSSFQRCFWPNEGLNTTHNITCTDWAYKALSQSPSQVDGCVGYYQWTAIVEHFFPFTWKGNTTNYQNALAAYIDNTLKYAPNFTSTNFGNGPNGGQMINTQAQFQLRFVKSDDMWMSQASHWPNMSNHIVGVIEMAYQPLSPQDTVSLNIWRKRVLELQKVGEKYGYRPHWGKENNVNLTYLRQMYPNISQFLNLRSQADPSCIFVNDYLMKTFELEGDCTLVVANQVDPACEVYGQNCSAPGTTQSPMTTAACPNVTCSPCKNCSKTASGKVMHLKRNVVLVLGAVFAMWLFA